MRDTILTAYLEAAAWTAEAEDRDYAPEAIERARQDVTAFVAKAGADLDGIAPAQVGHDFWLTRNHHGAGFWDRGLGAQGDRLTTLADGFGECDLVLGDDGLAYLE